MTSGVGYYIGKYKLSAADHEFVIAVCKGYGIRHREVMIKRPRKLGMIVKRELIYRLIKERSLTPEQVAGVFGTEPSNIVGTLGRYLKISRNSFPA